LAIPFYLQMARRFLKERWPWKVMDVELRFERHFGTIIALKENEKKDKRREKEENQRRSIIIHVHSRARGCGP
jgi:hypothetical protein